MSYCMSYMVPDQVITEICNKETIIRNSTIITYEGDTVFLRNGKKRYVWFKSNKSAERYTKALCISLFDDWNEKETLDVLEISLDEYFSTRIKYDGIESLLSFDGKHKLILSDNSLCFRIN